MAIGNTVKIKGTNGKNRLYKRSTCGSKSYLETLARTVRAAGGTARVLETSKDHYCLYKGPKSAVKRSIAGKRKRRR